MANNNILYKIDLVNLSTFLKREHLHQTGKAIAIALTKSPLKGVTRNLSKLLLQD